MATNFKNGVQTGSIDKFFSSQPTPKLSTPKPIPIPSSTARPTLKSAPPPKSNSNPKSTLSDSYASPSNSPPRDSFLCDECNKWINEDDKLEHLDQHFAEKLQREETNKSSTANKHKSPQSESKKTNNNNKKQKTVAKTAVNTPKIDSFFKPTK